MSLGPIAFGEREVTPPPGLASFTTEVDLRPEKNILLSASRRASTRARASSAWRFTSIDPDTGELTDRSRRRLLAPQRAARRKVRAASCSRWILAASLPTGTEIRNRASIVFDLNPAIATGEWLNTIDLEDPTSQVASAERAGVLAGDPR